MSALWIYLSYEIEGLLKFNNCDSTDINLRRYVNKGSFIRTAPLTKEKDRKMQKTLTKSLQTEIYYE